MTLDGSLTGCASSSINWGLEGLVNSENLSSSSEKSALTLVRRKQDGICKLLDTACHVVCGQYMSAPSWFWGVSFYDYRESPSNPNHQVWKPSSIRKRFDFSKGSLWLWVLVRARRHSELFTRVNSGKPPHWHPHFTGEATKAQTDWITHPKSSQCSSCWTQNLFFKWPKNVD